jgi:hypothetical protein
VPETGEASNRCLPRHCLSVDSRKTIHKLIVMLATTVGFGTGASAGQCYGAKNVSVPTEADPVEGHKHRTKVNLREEQYI